MLYELRTYNLQPGSVREVEKRFAESFEVRQKYSRMVALWHVEIGPINQILHLWAYESLQERADTRAAAVQDPSGKWPPKVSEFIVSQEVDILLASPINDPLDGPREWGDLYELRMYTYPAGAVRKVMDQFVEHVPRRAALYPLGGFFMSDLGQLNRFYQLWPYRNWEHRDEIRKRYAGTDIWPPHIEERPVHQLVRHMVPASCSPLH
jgi:hypothetical protein